MKCQDSRLPCVEPARGFSLVTRGLRESARGFSLVTPPARATNHHDVFPVHASIAGSLASKGLSRWIYLGSHTRRVVRNQTRSDPFQGLVGRKTPGRMGARSRYDLQPSRPALHARHTLHVASGMSVSSKHRERTYLHGLVSRQHLGFPYSKRVGALSLFVPKGHARSDARGGVGGTVG